MSNDRPKRLPPLAALRAFDAVARHLSIQKAATELGVTPAAVSQHIKALEADLGAALLRRVHRAVALTEAGQRLAPDLQAGFARLRAGIALLRTDEHAGTLTVSAAPALAAKWLVPRLGTFEAAHPGLALRLVAENTLCDFARDGIDVALRYGNGRYPGCTHHPFLDATVTPVCSPSLLRQAPPLKSPEELLGCVLLHDATSEGGSGLPGWRDWFAEAGISNAATGRGPRFSNAHLALEAAIAGRGVALAVEALAAADLASNRLVRPFAISTKGAGAYGIVSPEATASHPKVRHFRTWILRQTKPQQATPHR
jgi:LysR family glycine cleavage system transcriptional activator